MGAGESPHLEIIEVIELIQLIQLIPPPPLEINKLI